MSPLHPSLAAANDSPIATFLVRVEMPMATADEYLLLHEAMARLGFLKLVASDDGRVFHLPPAEYHGLSRLGVEGLRDVVQYTANHVKPGCAVLVTEAPSMAWTLPLAV